jgi:hypothetical protein
MAKIHGVTRTVMPKIPNYYTKGKEKWVTQYNPCLGGKLPLHVSTRVLLILWVPKRLHDSELSLFVFCPVARPTCCILRQIKFGSTPSRSDTVNCAFRSSDFIDNLKGRDLPVSVFLESFGHAVQPLSGLWLVGPESSIIQPRRELLKKLTGKLMIIL